MCIRDSFSWFLTEGLNGTADRNKDNSITVNELVSYVQTKVCLLYTSDAADERSSVDLGGRRIIKKKHRKTTSVTIETEET